MNNNRLEGIIYYISRDYYNNINNFIGFYIPYIINDGRVEINKNDNCIARLLDHERNEKTEVISVENCAYETFVLCK